MSEDTRHPLPIIERVEIIPGQDAVRATEVQAPFLTDEYGDWFIMKFEGLPGSRNVIARLRLAIPVGGLSDPRTGGLS